MFRHAVPPALLIARPAVARQGLAARCAAMAAEGIVAVCKRAIAEDPADDASLRNLGRAVLAVATTAAMRYGEVVEPAPTALPLHPGDVPALKVARIALQVSGRHAGAAPEIERLAAAGDTTAMYDLGEACEFGRGVARAAARLADANLNREFDIAADAAAAEMWARRARDDRGGPQSLACARPARVWRTTWRERQTIASRQSSVSG